MSLGKDPMVGLFLRDAENQGPIPTKEEQIRWVRKAQAGERGAWELLISRNLLFAFKMAKPFAYPRWMLLDCVQESILGLIRAIETFDPDKGVTFLSYAGWWCQQKARRYRRSMGNIVRIPEGKLRKGYSHREICMNSHPTLWQFADEIYAEKLGENLTGDELTDSVSQSEEFSRWYPRLKNALAKLSKEKRRVLQLKFGLGLCKEMRTVDVAKTMEMTRYKVYQSEISALKDLRKELGIPYTPCKVGSES